MPLTWGFPDHIPLHGHIVVTFALALGLRRVRQRRRERPGRRLVVAGQHVRVQRERDGRAGVADALADQLRARPNWYVAAECRNPCGPIRGSPAASHRSRKRDVIHCGHSGLPASPVNT